MRDLAPRPGPLGPVTARLALAGGLALTAGLVAVLSRVVVAAARTTLGGAARVDDVLGGLAAAGALAVLVRLGASAVATAAEVLRLPGEAGGRAGTPRLPGQAPVGWRHAVALLVTAAVATAATPARASGASRPPGVTSAELPRGSTPTGTASPVTPIALPSGPDARYDPAWGAIPAAAGIGTPTPAPDDPSLDPAWGAAARLRPTAAPESGVVVRRGDSLWDVAARHLGPHATDAEIAHAWPSWYAANRAVVGRDPDLLRPGQILVPPRPSTGGVL